MLGPAGSLIKIISGVDYSSEDVIYSLHCIKTNECIVKITTIENSIVEFPPGSFIKGAVYHIFFKKAEFDNNKAGFIGYKLLKKVE